MPADPTLDEKIAWVRQLMAHRNKAGSSEAVIARAVLANLEASRSAPLPDDEPPPEANDPYAEVMAGPALSLDQFLAAGAGEPQQPTDAERLAPVDEQIKALASCIAFAEHNVDSWWEYPESEAGLSARRHLAGLRGVLGRLSALDTAQSALVETKAEVARLKAENTKFVIDRCKAPFEDEHGEHSCEPEECRLARLRSPTATGEDRDAARLAIAKAISPQRWSNLNAGEESRELALAETLLASALAAARSQGVREERECIKRLIFTIRDKADRSRDWCNALNELQNALAPEPQDGSAQADDASGEGGE